MNAETQVRREAIVIGVLNAHGGFPVSTRTVRDAVAEQTHPADSCTWVHEALHRLAGKGEAQRWHPPGSRSLYWRR